ncbi:MAG: exo-alpha-sialidase [Lautropia sp.]
MSDRSPSRAAPSAAQLIVIIAAALAVAWCWIARIEHRRPALFDVAPPVVAAPLPPTVELLPALPPAGPEPIYLERFASRDDTRQVHASSAYWHQDRGLTAFWYGGSQEGARDVSIYTSRLEGGHWSAPRVVVERKRIKAELNRHVRKLGNATVYQHPDGRLWLFFVSVSVGGWAGSAINLIESRDDGRSWSPARRLVTSPLLNVSTLVRSSAIRYSDGSIGLPVYHELAGKFSELLRISPNGRILAKVRLSSGRLALQPELVATRPDHAIALLRNAGPSPRRLLYTTTDDAGRSWSPPVAIAMPNPDAAIDLLAADDGRLLAVLNDNEFNRSRLTLAVSENLGRDWRVIRTLEDRPETAGDGLVEYSYPWLLRAAIGEYHLLYTWNRTRIKHVQFNQAWLDQYRPRLGAAAGGLTALAPDGSPRRPDGATPRPDERLTAAR